MIFSYQIADDQGKTKKGQIEADSLAQAKAKLSTQPGTLLSLREMKVSTKKKSKLVFGRVSLQDRMMFAKHLTVMIRSGMPLDEALDTLTEQSSPILSKKLEVISEEVKKGNSLSNAIRKFPKVFDNLFVNMVAAGEAGGTLVKNLEIVATQQQKSYTLRSKIKSAIMYPVVIFLAIIGLIVVISVFVLPKLLGFFKSLNATLPLSTKILILGGDLFLAYWQVFFIGLFVLIVAIRISAKFPKPRLLLHTILIHLPIAGKISKNLNWSIFARSLASLLNSGVPIDQALKIVSQTQTSDVYKREVTILYHQVVKGVAMSEILEHNKYFPILVARMSRVGERSGNLSETLDYLADFYETEVDNYTKNLSTMLEPILLVTIGLLVGFVAMSIINPIYELTSKVSQ